MLWIPVKYRNTHLSAQHRWQSRLLFAWTSCLPGFAFVLYKSYGSLLRSPSGRSHVTLPVPTRLLQTDIHSFLGNKPINVWLSFCCECSHLWLVQRIQWQLNERLIGPSKQKRKTPRKECMSVWSSRVGTGSVTWLRPERLRRRLILWQTFQPLLRRNREALLAPKALRRAARARASREVWGHAPPPLEILQI